ncbi:hypothetical protein [Rhodococcus sp. NPDC047139]|uniref:hypothetical protein n=1 Tax=Rhodococcus sp. NPDC047139 TaxID=3155141 RepID=UPI0033E9E563
MSTAYENPGELASHFEWSGETEDEYQEGSYQEFQGEEESYALEQELAMELLEITSEEELDQFLGKLARSVVRGAGKFIKSPIGKALGGVLKSVAKAGLPMVGGAIGSFIAPGIGTALGSKLGSMASKLLEAEEAEALGEIAAEEEAARRYVRFARASYRNAYRTPRYVPPQVAVRAATVGAARMYAPALLRTSAPSPWRRRRRGYDRSGYGWVNNDGRGTWGQDMGWNAPRTEGRWVRQGGQVVLYGL